MSGNDDPLLRAIADGDPNCPDGEKLSALGKLIRSATAPQERDLVAGVLARINKAEARDTSLEEAVDDYCEGAGTADKQIGALFQLIHGACQPPHAVDLVSRVERALEAGPRQSQPITLDARSRWGVWSTVVAGHVAALIAVAVYQFGFDEPGDRDDSNPSAIVEHGTTEGRAVHIGGTPTAPPKLERAPTSWNEIGNFSLELFAPRRSNVSREKARREFQMTASAPTIAQGLAWLQMQQRDDGHFGDVAANSDRDLAAQSLAVLSLLGEGLGDEVRLDHARRGLYWLVAQADQRGAFLNCSPVTAGMVSLALVEGGILLDDERLRIAAENALAGLGTLPLKPEASGLGGFSLLAYEIAAHSGFSVPAAALEQARRDIGSQAGANDALGRLGLSSFASMIAGTNAWMPQVLAIARQKPEVDASGRADPLSWFFPTLALREFGGVAWDGWSQALETALLGQFEHGDGLAWVAAEKVRYAQATHSGGDLFATSLALINLQAPYRYLPLAKR